MPFCGQRYIILYACTFGFFFLFILGFFRGSVLVGGRLFVRLGPVLIMIPFLFFSDRWIEPENLLMY